MPSEPAHGRRTTALVLGAVVAVVLTGAGATTWWWLNRSSIDEPVTTVAVTAPVVPGMLGAFDPSGTLLTIDGDLIRFWDTGTRTEARTPLEHADASRIELTPDGELLAALCDCRGNSGEIDLIDVDTGNTVCEIADARVGFDMAFSPDGRSLATGGDDVALIWDTTTCAQTAQLQWKSGAVTAVGYTSFGMLVAASADSSVAFYNPVVFDPNPDDDRHVDGITHFGDGPVNTLAISRTGELATGTETGVIQLWNTYLAEKLPLALYASTALRDIAFSPDGRTLAGLSDAARLFDVETGAVTDDDVFDGVAVDGDRIMFSPDGAVIAASTADGTVVAEVGR